MQFLCAANVVYKLSHLIFNSFLKVYFKSVILWMFSIVLFYGRMWGDYTMYLVVSTMIL